MPVDLSGPNSIIQAFQLGQESKLRRETLKQKADQDKIENDRKQAELDNQKEQFRLTNEVAKQTITLAQAKAAIDHAKASQDIFTGISQGQALPAGATQTPVTQILGPDGGIDPAMQAGNPTNLGMDTNIPGVGSQVIPTQDQYYAQQAKNQETALAPKLDSAIKQVQARESAISQREQEVNTLKAEQLKAQKEIENKAKEQAARNAFKSKFDLETYKQTQANYRKSLGGSSGGSNKAGDTAAFSAAKTLGTAHDSNALTRRAFLAKEAQTFVNGMDAKVVDPTQDIGLIYSFAKAMDPDSAVREGEYKTVQEYAQALADKFGLQVGRLFDSGNILTSEARQRMISMVDKRTNATLDTYDQYRGTVVNRINTAARGKVNGEDYLGPSPSGRSGLSSKAKTEEEPDFLKNAPEVNSLGHKLDREASKKAGRRLYRAN